MRILYPQRDFDEIKEHTRLENEQLREENLRLRNLNTALMNRVELSLTQQTNAFALFEAAINFDSKVHERTRELEESMHALERCHHELWQAKSIAEAANSSKNSFLASLSHDLLQPLNAARLALSALDETPIDVSGRRLLSQVERALTILEDLIRTLLDISKLDAGVMSPQIRSFRIDDILAPLAEEFAPIAQRRNLRLKVLPCSAVISSDSLMLRRILQNLLGNALRYTSQGGVLVGCRKRGDWLKIDVVDSGPGIATEHHEAIFLEFQRFGAGSESGFGLGLTIVQRLTRALGHPLNLRSNVGRGSSFSIIVPISDDLPTQEKLPTIGELANIANPLCNAYIMVIENEQRVSDAMEALLTSWGCKVCSARGTKDAIELCDTKGTRPDLIIADLHLDAGELGVQSIAALRQHFSHIIPACIATADVHAVNNAPNNSDNLDYVQKPIKPAQLRSLMNHLLSPKQ